MRAPRPLVATLALAVAVSMMAPLVATSTAGAADDVACQAMGAPAYQRVNPANQVMLVTPWQSEAEGAAANFGFTVDLGSPMRVSTRPAQDLVGVHRLYHPVTRDFAYIANEGEIANAQARYGYVDQGTVFHAAPVAMTCTVPVYRFLRGPVHRLALADQQATLEADGWRLEVIAFHAIADGSTPPPPPPPPPTTPPPTTPPGPADPTFSFAVIPDTQNETYSGEVRMQERVEWLLANRQGLDLRWVLHSGDVHNWDTPDHAQFSAMSGWLRPLDNAGLPMVLTVGNHDTAAVRPGGSACPGQNANLALRNTSTWNSYYSPARFGFNGVFEAGKSDNGWRTFIAGDKDWLVLSLELWPRTAVIDWAEQVVADHPHHNVIVLTHAFLEGDGRLSTSNGGYGANSPATLWNALDDYPNVVMTFSGHVGQAANTSLNAPDGHRVATFLQSFHDPALNPTRIVTVDTAAGTISTRIVANWDRVLRQNVDREYTEYRATISGMRFVD